MIKLPNGWKYGKIRDIASDEKHSIVDGPFGSDLKNKDYVANGNIPVLTTKNINGNFSSESMRYITNDKFETIKRSAIRGNDIIMAKIGSCGKCAIYPKDMSTGMIPANLLKVTVSNRHSIKFVYYYFKSPFFERILKKIIRNTAQPAFNVSKFRDLFLPIPPLKDQKLIVSEIEKQFMRLDDAIKTLREVKNKLEIYRKSILLMTLPEECSEIKEDTIKNLFKIIDYRGRTPHFSEKGIPHLRTPNIRNGKVIYDKLKYVSEETYQKYMTRGLPEEGDILFTTEAPLGEVALIPKIKFSLAQRMIIIRPPNNIYSKWLLYYFMSPYFQSYVTYKKTGTTVSGVSSRNIKSITINYPPRHIQKQIVQEIESRFSVIEKLEETVDKALKKSELLRKSILKSAFEGKLVKYNGDSNEN